MKIRTKFAFLAATLVAIPVVLFAMGMVFWNLTRSIEPIPLYAELAPGAESLTDKKTWDEVRTVLVNRPIKAETLVFDPTFHLIYSSIPLGSIAQEGQTVDFQQSVKALQDSTVARNIMIYRPAGTPVWIVQVQNDVAPPSAVAQKALLGFSIGLLIVLVVSMALAVIVGRRMANAVVRLEQAARGIARGDLATPVVLPRGNDEIRSLAGALETMRLGLIEEGARQSRFVMGVSHDLKTPLALIKGYVELIKDGPAVSASARDGHFEVILDKADQLDGMIDHLIDYGKVNTGEWQQTWKPLALGPFLEEFGASLEPDARLLSRNVVRDISLPAAWTVACDARSIRRSLENLVHNALRYTEVGGTVGIQARALESGGAEVIVWDDGPGLDPADRPHLFDPFYRGTHSRREPGMGLGLSIVKTIVDSHGWTIRAESDRGARFIVGIPTSSRSAGMAAP
jgi:signal transduction histidine kinase